MFIENSEIGKLDSNCKSMDSNSGQKKDLDKGLVSMRMDDRALEEEQVSD